MNSKFTDALNDQIVKDSEVQRHMKEALLKHGVPYSSNDDQYDIAIKYRLLIEDIVKPINEKGLTATQINEFQAAQTNNALATRGVEPINTKIVGFNGPAIHQSIIEATDFKGFSFKKALKSVGKNLKTSTLTPVTLAKMAVGKASAQEKKDFFQHHGAFTSVVGEVIPVFKLPAAILNKGLIKAEEKLALEKAEALQKQLADRRKTFSDEAIVYYMQNNPDVMEAAKKSHDPMLFAYQHWFNHGQKENRPKNPVEFEARRKQALAGNNAAAQKIAVAEKQAVANEGVQMMTAGMNPFIIVVIVGVLVTFLISKFVKK